MGTHLIFESDFDCLTDLESANLLTTVELSTSTSRQVKKQKCQLTRKVKRISKPAVASRSTRSVSPLRQRTALLLSASPTSSSRPPRTRTSRSRDPFACQPRPCVSQPVKHQMVKVPRPGIVFKCESTSA